MTGDDDEIEHQAYASPACSMHEVDPAYPGSAAVSMARADAMRWRKVERERLIAARLAIPSEVRRLHGERIAAHLQAAIGDVTGLIVSAYWPFRGEPNLLAFLEGVAKRGGRTALPVVMTRAQPLVFRLWSKGDPLVRGVWNIPVPVDNAEVVLPDVVIAPVVGFDPHGYRLGYGGGFFDRTLAAMPHPPRVFGVGYGEVAIATIHPLPHDIAMDCVVTEDGIAARKRSAA